MNIQKKFSGILCACFSLVYSIFLFCLSINQLNVEGLIDLYKGFYISDLIFSVIIFLISLIGVIYYSKEDCEHPLFLFALLFSFLAYKIIQIIIYFSNHGEGNFEVIFSLILLIISLIVFIIDFIFIKTEEVNVIDSVLPIPCSVSYVVLYLKLDNNMCDFILSLVCLVLILVGFVIFGLKDVQLSSYYHNKERSVNFDKKTTQTNIASQDKAITSEEVNTDVYSNKKSDFKEENKAHSLENKEGFFKSNYTYKNGYKVDFVPKGTKIKILNSDSSGNCEISFIDSSNKEVVLKNVSNLYFETKN